MITIVSTTRKTAADIAPIFHASRPSSLVSKQIQSDTGSKGGDGGGGVRHWVLRWIHSNLPIRNSRGWYTLSCNNWINCPWTAHKGSCTLTPHLFSPLSHYSFPDTKSTGSSRQTNCHPAVTNHACSKRETCVMHGGIGSVWGTYFSSTLVKQKKAFHAGPKSPVFPHQFESDLLLIQMEQHQLGHLHVLLAGLMMSCFLLLYSTQVLNCRESALIFNQVPWNSDMQLWTCTPDDYAIISISVQLSSNVFLMRN